MLWDPSPPVKVWNKEKKTAWDYCGEDSRAVRFTYDELGSSIYHSKIYHYEATEGAEAAAQEVASLSCLLRVSNTKTSVKWNNQAAYN